MVYPRHECYILYPSHEGTIPKGDRISSEYIEIRPHQWRNLGQLGYVAPLRQFRNRRISSANPSVLGHCHLMMDNLQEAYTSYQQALYHLRDPKVGGSLSGTCGCANVTLTCDRVFRNRNCGMGLVSSMTAMALLIMRRKLSLRLCEWPRTSKRPTKSTSDWV